MPYSMKEKKCAYCGKMFIPAPFHSYKLYDEDGELLFCIRSCKLRYEERMKAKEKSHKVTQRQKTRSKSR